MAARANKSRYSYFMLTSIDDAGHTSWAICIKQIHFKLGFGFVWISQDVGDISSFIGVFEHRLFDILQQEWVSPLRS